MLSPELQVWIHEHEPKTASQAATLVEVFMDACKRGQPWYWKASKKAHRLKLSTNLPNQPQRNLSSPVEPPGGGHDLGTTFKNAREIPICYLCGQEGHKKLVCPRNTVKTFHLLCAQGNTVPQVKSELSPQLTTMEVNGRELNALINTESDQTRVHWNFIPPALFNSSEKKSICSVHSDEKLLPTADVYIKVKGQTYILDVGIAGHLPFPVLQGHDLPVLLDLLQPVPTCNMVVKAPIQNEPRAWNWAAAWCLTPLWGWHRNPQLYKEEIQ